MAISASQIVNVTPRVISAGATDLEITGLFLTDNELCTFPQPLKFSSAKSVGAWFGLDSDEYSVAVNYFLGYDNSFKKPRAIHFGRLATSAISAVLIGTDAASMSELKKITAGTLTIEVDGTTKTTSALNLSTCTTQSDVAVKIQSAITGTTVSYNSNLNAFVITSGTTGESSALSQAEETDAAVALGLSDGTVSSGADAMELADNMDSIKNADSNWVSFTTLTEADDDTVLALAEWTNDQDAEYLYCPYTTAKANYSTVSSSTLPKQLAAKDYEGTVLSFGGIEIATLAMSIGACIDWDRTNGLVNWAFRKQTGIEPTVTDNLVAENCVSLNLNYYGKWATRNDDFSYYYKGAMIGGQYGYVDAYVGNIWLRNALQVSIMNGLVSIGRVPYIDQGYTTIRAWCADPIDRALVNGVIQPGVSLSESQKAQLMNEIGEDVSDKINTDGYYLLISDPGASVRAKRESPTMGLWYTYGGAVNKIELPVTAVL